MKHVMFPGPDESEEKCRAHGTLRAPGLTCATEGCDKLATYCAVRCDDHLPAKGLREERDRLRAHVESIRAIAVQCELWKILNICDLAMGSLSEGEEPR